MKIKSVLLLSTIILAQLAFAGSKVNMDSKRFKCTSKSLGELNFALNTSTNTITFSNVKALSKSLPERITLGVKTLAYKETLKVGFEYNPHFSGSFELSFDKSYVKILEVKSATMELTGDDGDGSIYNKESFSCILK